VFEATRAMSVLAQPDRITVHTSGTRASPGPSAALTRTSASAFPPLESCRSACEGSWCELSRQPSGQRRRDDRMRRPDHDVPYAY
jgi:hypothetical protein